jgi:hypothetical protein
MTIFEKNLNALAEIHAPLAHVLREREEPKNLDFFKAVSGALTCMIGGKLVHSRRDPEREAERLASSSGNGGNGYFILLGFGLGYSAEACLRLFPESRIIAVIPDASFFARVLRERDLTHLIKDSSVTFALEPGPEEIAPLLSDIRGLDYTVLRNRGITGTYGDYFRKIEEAISSFRSKQEINLNTLIRFGRRWVNNLLQNIRVLQESENVGELAGLFTGVPCLLLAAGPTLDKIAEDLPTWRERCLLIAVDTAAGFCARLGVEPDFLVVVDPQYWNSRYLERTSFNRTVLVSESSTHPRVFRLLPLKTYFCGSLFPLGKYLEGFIGERGTLGAGGSVATTAWDFARMLGCSPLFCAGLDLGFPRMQTHYRGSFFEESIHSIESRLDPGEGRIFSYTYGAGPFPSENYSGGRTLTDKRLVLYKWWFEGQARSVRRTAAENRDSRLKPDGPAGTANAQPQHDAPVGTADAQPQHDAPVGTADAQPQHDAPVGTSDSLPRTRVLSGESVKIEGFEAADPGIVRNLKPCRRNIDKILASIWKPNLHPSNRQDSGISDGKKERLAEGCRRLIDELYELGELAERGVQEVQKILPRLRSGGLRGLDADTLRRLDEIDAEILSSGTREIAGFLLQQVAKEISESAVESGGSAVSLEGPQPAAVLETGKSAAALENSLKLYQALSDSVGYHIRLLRQALDRL